jgi:hypothetical protein
MKEFVLIFRTNDPAFKPTPEQLQERMNWLAGIAAQNKLADKGQTLSVTGAVTLHPNEVVTDGPFTEIKEFISGFVILKTDTIEEAIELARRNPVFQIGGSIEIREVVKRQ